MENRNKGAYLSLLAMMGMMSGPYSQELHNIYDEYDKPMDKPKKQKIDTEPKIKICFRPGCEKERTRGKLYCSKECCILDKERIKNKNK